MQLQHEIVRPHPARRDQHLEHRLVGVDVDGQRRIGNERARRRREAPAGDDGEDAERDDAFEQDRSRQRLVRRRRASAGVRRKRFSAARPSRTATSASLIERMMPYLVVDQRAKTFELDGRERQVPSARGRRPRASRSSKTGSRPEALRPCATRAARPAAPARRARTPRQRRAGTPPAVSALAAARWRHVRWPQATVRRRACAIAESVRAMPRVAPQRHDAEAERRDRNQQRRPEAGAERDLPWAAAAKSRRAAAQARRALESRAKPPR